MPTRRLAPASGSGLIATSFWFSFFRLVALRCWGLFQGFCLLPAMVSPPEPTENAECGHPDDTAGEDARRDQATNGVKPVAIDAGITGTRSWSAPSVGGGNPAGQVGKTLRGARGTALRLVHFLAVETETSHMELHSPSVGHARPTMARAPWRSGAE
jgi:hypothetical protein